MSPYSVSSPAALAKAGKPKCHGSMNEAKPVKFYPTGNGTFAYIAYLANFAVGFLVRPFGALFFGRIGDLAGRK